MPYLNTNTGAKNLQVEKSDYRPSINEFVKIRKEGKHYMSVKKQLKATQPQVIKISKDEYIYKPDGEIRQYKATGERLAHAHNLTRTFDNLRAIIRANFVNKGETGCYSQLFITLTYKENMQDSARLMHDFELYIKKLKRKVVGLEYVAVAEPQERGAWHMHVMAKTTTGKYWWLNRVAHNKLWVHGFSSVKRLKSDDIGRYYVSYFTNLSSDKKGSRLHMYPPYFKFYRTSRGITKPKFDKEMELRHVQGMEVFNSTMDIKNADTGEVINSVYRATFKR